MKTKFAIIALLLVCVLALAACHKKTSAPTTTNKDQTTQTNAPTTTTEATLKGEEHEHENNGFMCTECGEEFVSQSDLLEFIGSVVTEGYVIKTQNIVLVDDWYTSSIDEVEVTVKADEIAIKANATLSSEYFTKDLTVSAEGLYEDGAVYLEGKGVGGIFTLFNVRQDVEEEDFDNVVSIKLELEDLIGKSEELVQIAGAAELVQMLLNNLEKYAKAIETASKLINTESLKILNSQLHSVVLTLLENTSSFKKTETGFKFAFDLARTVEYAKSLSGKTVGDILGITAIDKAVIEGAIVGALSLPIKPFIDLFPVNEVAEDILKFAEDNELAEEITQAVEMGKEMYNAYYDQFKELTVFDTIKMIMNAAETEEEVEEETQEPTALDVAKFVVGTFDTVVPELEIPELPEGFEVVFAITTDKSFEPTKIEISAMGYSLVADAKANSSVNKENLKAITFALTDADIELYCRQYVEEENAEGWANDVYEVIEDENGKVIGYRDIYTMNSSWYSSENGQSVPYTTICTSEYIFKDYIVYGKSEECNGVSYQVFYQYSRTSEVSAEDLAVVSAGLSEEEYAEFLDSNVYAYTETKTEDFSFVKTEDGFVAVNYFEHDETPEVDANGETVVTTSEDGVVATTKYTCKNCGKTYNYYYNLSMQED